MRIAKDSNGQTRIISDAIIMSTNNSKLFNALRKSRNSDIHTVTFKLCPHSSPTLAEGWPAKTFPPSRSRPLAFFRRRSPRRLDGSVIAAFCRVLVQVLVVRIGHGTKGSVMGRR
jgi:hypothetical protein